MNSTWNSTSSSYHTSTESYMILSVICIVSYVIIVIAAGIGNTLVCVAFCLGPVLRKSPTNYFILSLAISDLITATLCIPFDVEQMLVNWEWSHGPFMCSLWTTVYLIAVPSSILSLLAVSVDRYKALSDPLNRFRQTRFMTRKRACVVIVTLWVYSFLFAIMPELGWKRYPENIIGNACVFNTTTSYFVLTSLLNFAFPVLIMCMLYLRIYRIARTIKSAPRLVNKSSSIDHAHDANQERDQKRFHKTVKTTKNILVVVCTFFFCWMPYITLSFVTLFCLPCYFAAPQLQTIFLILGYSNSAMNPYLYAFRNRKFQETFVKFARSLRMLRSDKSSSRRSQTHPTTPTKLSDSPFETRPVQLMSFKFQEDALE